MERYPIPPSSPGRKGLTVVSFVAVAGLFLLIGVIIASRLDLSSPSVAQTPTNIAQTGLFPVVDKDGEPQSPFVEVVQRVQDAVVNISATSREENIPWWQRGAGYSTSSGSGFFFREDGYILTNNHVVKNADRLTVSTSAGYKYEAKLVGADPATDLAVLKVEPEEKVTTIPFGDSEKLRVGDWAIAIGNPFPQQGLDRTVTVGVISAKGRSNLNFGQETPRYQDFIQTDASINPGNSGGPLLNLRGECIGVNSAISSPTGTSVGIGFAIPINLARAIVPDLIASGHASRGWLGVFLDRVSEREARRQGLSNVKGVRIDSVFNNSPADKAGIERGDIIVEFNNKVVEDPSQFSVLVSTAKSGASVPITLLRDGEKISTSTIIADQDSWSSLPSSGTGSGTQDFPARLWMGMEVIAFTKDVAEVLSLDYVPGLYVQRVYPGSPADGASITKGAVILQVNNTTIRSIADLEEIARKIQGTEQRVPVIVQEPDGTISRKVLKT